MQVKVSIRKGRLRLGESHDCRGVQGNPRSRGGSAAASGTQPSPRPAGMLCVYSESWPRNPESSWVCRLIKSAELSLRIIVLSRAKFD